MRVWLPEWSCSRSTFDLGFRRGHDAVHRLPAQIHHLGPPQAIIVTWVMRITPRMRWR